MKTCIAHGHDGVNRQDSDCHYIVYNDTAHAGFQVLMQPVSNAKLNQVQALSDYIVWTQSVRPTGDPVFLSLLPPHGPISAATVSSILNKAIQLAGLANLGFSAKCFRATSATAVIDLGHDLEITMHQGRWKTRSVFFITMFILSHHPCREIF